MPFQMAGDKSVSAFPDGDNLLSWKGTITGAAGTVTLISRLFAIFYQGPLRCRYV